MKKDLEPGTSRSSNLHQYHKSYLKFVLVKRKNKLGSRKCQRNFTFPIPNHILWVKTFNRVKTKKGGRKKE